MRTVRRADLLALGQEVVAGWNLVGRAAESAPKANPELRHCRGAARSRSRRTASIEGRSQTGMSKRHCSCCRDLARCEDAPVS